MLTLESLVDLAEQHRSAFAFPVDSFRVGDRAFDTDREPVVMGVVNLSRDSTYRESIAPTLGDAVRRSVVLHAQGAHVIDIGAESSRADAVRVGVETQIEQLIPLVEALVQRDIPVSVEAYEVEVIRSALAAGASVVNLTGTKDEDAIYRAIAEHDASLVMCFTPGDTVRDELEVRIQADPIPPLIDHFAPRIERARTAGVRSVSVDPGLGFFYGSSVGPIRKAQHQAQVLLHSFRLRTLGVPVCQIMPHAFDLFQEEFRSAEGVFAVLGKLGGVGIMRVHEVSRVVATLRMMAIIGTRLPEHP